MTPVLFIDDRIDAPRGFSLRHGKRARLLRPKRGKAAIRAAIQGQGLEVLRGRSAFSRSVNAPKRKIRSGLAKECAEFVYKQRRQDLRSRLSMMTAELADWFEFGEIADIDRSGEEADEYEERKHCEYVEIIEETLDPLERQLRNFGHRMESAHRTIVNVAAIKADEPFTCLQRSFLLQHGSALCKSLQFCYRQRLHLSPAPLSPDVQKRFLDLCQGTSAVNGTLRPAFHGTAAKNISSILKRGLLIPGEQNDVKVANGSAHGLGIYTGMLGQDGANLSYGFSKGGPMLVCVVLDDAKPVPQYTVGIQNVTAESNIIRHVGSAIISFDSRRVVPLFIASPGNPWPVKNNSSPLQKLREVFSFNFTKHYDRIERLKEQYPEKEFRLKPRLCCQAKRLNHPVAFLRRRAARKRCPRMM